GCLTDNVFARTLSSKSSSTDTNTHTTCASFCTGYLYFGVEYGRECYCGDALANNPSTVPDSDCDVPCSGNASLICGAGNRLNVWKSDTITTPPSTPSITGYTYEGCYTDSVVNRTLTSGFYYDSAMTNAMCKDLCDGATLFGTEYGSECYCGEALGNSTQQVAESQCSFVCSGSDTEYCGAGERLTLW
ncbi:carbohydrate-binding WSC, partial [Lojkania enalia]